MNRFTYFSPLFFEISEDFSLFPFDSFRFVVEEKLLRLILLKFVSLTFLFLLLYCIYENTRVSECGWKWNFCLPVFSCGLGNGSNSRLEMFVQLVAVN